MFKVNLTTDDLTWSRKSRTFAVELSDLHRSPMLPAYIEVVSKKSGAVATYVFDRADRDAENDVSAWVYVPTIDTLQMIPALRETAIIVFND